MRTGAHLALTCLLTGVLRAYSPGACVRTTSLRAYCTRQVHVGSREFEHLRDYDMNALCARVVVTATRPGAAT